MDGLIWLLATGASGIIGGQCIVWIAGRLGFTDIKAFRLHQTDD